MRAGAFLDLRVAAVAALALAAGHAFAARAWGLEYAGAALVADVLAGAVAGLLLAAALPTWPRRLALLALLLAPVLLQSWKLVTFGQPIAFGDAVAFVALVEVLAGGRKVAAVAVVLAFLWALWMVRPPIGQGRARLLGWAAGWLSLGLVAGGAGALLADGDDAAADRRLLASGGLGYSVHILLDGLAGSDDAPSARDVVRARATLGPPGGIAAGAPPTRSVHLVLLESVWDPLRLSAYAFSRDPFDPRFRALLEAGEGGVLVPGFGGATANAEFEVLCGLPADGTDVLFERGLPPALPCLPALLRAAGYATLAQHPFREGFWSRDRAYPALGFTTYLHERAFDLADADGSFLADGSLFAQARALDGDGARRFVYTVTLSSHFPYDRDDRQRPALVHVRPASPMLQAYANAVAYTTAAFMDHLEAVLAEDPDALVIAFGDHAPALGPAPNPYTASGLPFVNEALRERSFPRLAETPLVVVDGRRGVVRTGRMPLYAVPYLALDLLSGGGLQLPLQAAFAPGRPARTSRWFFGRRLLAGDGGGPWRACAPLSEDAECLDAGRVGEALLLLRRDLLEGQQYTRLAAGVAAVPGGRQAKGLVRFADCDATPRALQPDFLLVPPGGGASALVLLLQDSRGEPGIRIGRATFPMQGRSAERSALLPHSTLRALAGRQPVAWACPGPGGASGGMGWIDIVDAAVPPTEPTGTCALAVAAWGPASTPAGVAFNAPAPGRSALWLTGVETVGDVAFAVGGVPAVASTSGSTVTLSFASDALLREEGVHPVAWYCRDGSGGTLGVLTVGPAGAR